MTGSSAPPPWTPASRPPADDLEAVKSLAHASGALLIFDELITGFRWHLGGAQTEYGVTADLAAFGKAMANGFSVSALVGRSDLMRLGGSDHDRERVFLLSTTHGAETHQLAAAIATMGIYRDEPVVPTLYAMGARLRRGVDQVAVAHGVSDHVGVISRGGKPSQAFRTLFMQEMVERGVIAPSFVVSYSHTDEDVDRTIEAVDGALGIYQRALGDGAERYVRGRHIKPAIRRTS